MSDVVNSSDAPDQPEADPSARLQDEPVEVHPIPTPRKIAVLGEIPFAGRAVAQALVRAGFAVKVLCPDDRAETLVRGVADVLAALPDPARENGVTLPPAERIEVTHGDVGSIAAIETTLHGTYGACMLSPITLSGRMYRAAQHVDDVQRVVRAAEGCSLRKLVYHSALGAYPEARSRALKQAADAEEILHGAKCEDFRVRTGPLMGKGDEFLTSIVGEVLRPSPAMWVMGYGGTPMQPLHVDDLARCVTRIFSDQPEELRAGYYCLAGPETTTVLELLDAAFAKLGRNKLKFHVPLFVLNLICGMRKGNGFKERVSLLFEVFCTEQNDAVQLLTPATLITPLQAQDEVLAK